MKTRRRHSSRVLPCRHRPCRRARCVALGQRVFKSEPQVAQTAPNATTLGTPFVNWLQTNFGWLFAQAQANATLGQSYVYDDAQLSSTPTLLGEYGNGSSQTQGRSEYLWLPQDDGSAMPIGLYSNNRLYAINADHLNTPRQITADTNATAWQLPYSAFGDNKPTGVLAMAGAARLRGTLPAVTFNLRYPGQYFDEESNLSYNYFRSYQAGQGRYTQSDPIGLEGGWNKFGYVEGNPLSLIDPMGLQTTVDSWCRQNPVACAEINGVKPIRIPPPIVFPDDCNDACKKAVTDASNAYWKLTTKRLPQYESGGTRGRDANHLRSINELRNALLAAIKRVKLHCTTPPAQLPEWERAANEPLPS